MQVRLGRVEWTVWSGWRDLNSRPLDPQIGGIGLCVSGEGGCSSRSIACKRSVMANRGRWAHIGPKFGALTPSNAMVAWETQATGCKRCRDWSRCHLRSAPGALSLPLTPRTATEATRSRRCGQVVETAFGLS
jgi:hypothetical protein